MCSLPVREIDWESESESKNYIRFESGAKIDDIEYKVNLGKEMELA